MPINNLEHSGSNMKLYSAAITEPRFVLSVCHEPSSGFRCRGRDIARSESSGGRSGGCGQGSRGGGRGNGRGGGRDRGGGNGRGGGQTTDSTAADGSQFVSEREAG